jgi:hypothetical protein
MDPAASAATADENVNDSVDAILRRDPARAYAGMDARSREDYRNRVRNWAGRSRRSADDIARMAIELATAAEHRHGASDRRAHVGYYLTDAGIAALAGGLQTTLDWRERLRLRDPDRLLLAYCGVAYSLCIAYGIASVWLFDIRMPFAGQAMLALAAAIYISGIIPGWFNMFLSRALMPRLVPRLDFANGIPESAKTLVVIPSLLTSPAGIDRLAQTLERLHLDNPGCGAGYAILSDFVDADTERVDGDDALLETARARIDALNARHGRGFVLLHRPRRWNAGEGRWIGWERKRGKLEELNAFLAGEAAPFQTLYGDLDTVDGARYVLTLDDDNAELSPGAVHQLAGALAHPLHRPVLSADGKRVEAGYVILLPRPKFTLPENEAPSRLEKLFHSTVRIETSAEHHAPEPVVDVDQDVFGQTVYMGKGIYDAHLFHRLTRGLIAENTILNHDALEGALVRAGVVTDVVLDEIFVPSFYAAARRTHRWQRGDWQLIPWLFPALRDAAGKRIRNPLSLFGRWKLFQNVLRVLSPIAAIVCFAVGWATSGEPVPWTLNLLAVAWIPALVGMLLGTIQSLRFGQFGWMIRGVAASVSMRAAPFIFAVEYARNALDAALRASYRMWISRRRMLEWTASIVVSSQRGLTLVEYYRMLWCSPVFAVALACFIARFNPPALWSALPFAMLWAMAPFIAWWWSQKPGAKTPANTSPAA